MTTSKDITFKKLPEVDNISEVINDVFGVQLDISGGWGYDTSMPVIINSLDIPKDQFFHMFGSIRANIQMNLSLEEDERYGAINVILDDKKKSTVDNFEYDIIKFKVSAIKEKEYAEFIQEYKDNYGKKEFDIGDHFKRREASTLKLIDTIYFRTNDEK